MKRAFEDYRLLKTAEGKFGREETLRMLRVEGVEEVYKYPRSAIWHQMFREKLIRTLEA